MVNGGNTEPSSPGEHRTVGRVMSILELVTSSDDRGVRLGDLASELSAPKSSLHALVRGLLSTGYLREEGGRYLVGPAFPGLVAAAPEAPWSSYRQTLSELAAMWNETAMLGTLVGDSVVYVDCVEGGNLIRARPDLNKRLVLWPRSSGKIFLMHMEARGLEAYLRRNHRDPVDAATVRSELEITREAGYGVNIGGSVSGHIGIAVPAVHGKTPVTMSIGLAGPRSRIESRVDEIAKSMREAVAVLPH